VDLKTSVFEEGVETPQLPPLVHLVYVLQEPATNADNIMNKS